MKRILFSHPNKNTGEVGGAHRLRSAMPRVPGSFLDVALTRIWAPAARQKVLLGDHRNSVAFVGFKFSQGRVIRDFDIEEYRPRFSGHRRYKELAHNAADLYSALLIKPRLIFGKPVSEAARRAYILRRSAK